MESEFKQPDNPDNDTINPNFRLWLTCDPTNE